MKKIIGLTGGSGAGKSTVSKLFCSLGAHTVDGDVVARRVVEKGKPALIEITEVFGTGVLQPDGSLNRAALAKIVFSDPADLHKLNRITHKYISEEIMHEIERFEKTVFVIDAAALFESGLDAICDVTVCVTADEEIRLGRIMARDGLTKERAKARIQAQKSEAFYREKCDFEIRNNGDQAALSASVTEIMQGVCSE